MLASLVLLHGWSDEGMHAQAQSGEKRLALVVGNAAYKQFPLDNPVRDARAMAAMLRELGFEVTLFENIGGAKFRRELATFARRVRTEDGVSLFYYAGHGIAARGRNLLIPVDGDMSTEANAFAEPVDVAFHLLTEIDNGKKQTNLIVLDACRLDPFGDSPGRRGLVEMSAKNSLIAFATRPGDGALDGELGKNGVFTGSLLAQLAVPGLEVRPLFTRVRVDVLEKTQQQQYPYVNDLLVRDFVFRTAESPKPAVQASGEQQRTDATIAVIREQQQELEKLVSELTALRQERDEARKLADMARERMKVAALATESPVASPASGTPSARVESVEAERARPAAAVKAAEERYRAAADRDRVAQLKLLRAEEMPQLALLGIAPEPAPAVVDATGDIFARGVKLPGNLRIVPAAAAVPAECSVFLGAWGHARWDLKRTAEIWIEEVAPDCTVKATYGRGGVSLDSEAPTYQRVSGKIEGGELRLALAGGQRIVARATREKTLKAEWTGNGARSVSEFDPISPKPDAPAGVYALEDEHDGSAPIAVVSAGNFNRALPRQVAGATTISTLELRALLDKKKDVILVDAINEAPHRSLPGALWFREIGQASGRGYALGAKELNEIRDGLARASGGDFSRPVVVFDRSIAYGWLGYHGALRILGLGYSNVYWYRGGLDAWHDAGLLVAQAKP